jgi:transposase
MGKSYKKYPLLIQDKRQDYRLLNRQLRYDKSAELPNGSAFKKHRPHWYSWSYRWSREQAIQTYREEPRIQKQFLTLEEWLNYWESCTIRK